MAFLDGEYEFDEAAFRTDTIEQFPRAESGDALDTENAADAKDAAETGGSQETGDSDQAGDTEPAPPAQD